MRRNLFPWIAAAVACVGVAFGGVACAQHTVDLSVQAPATLATEPGGYEEAIVTRVVDGDTIEVEITSVAMGPGAGDAEVGGRYDVRLLGIDTPESVRPGTPVECFGREASAATKAFLEGESILLVKDVEETDRYDRLLRYVYLGSEMANARLVSNGYAAAYTYPPNVRHADLFVSLEREARNSARGLWDPAVCADN
jgi:endonuclease YncB( thermonuclease family)